MINFNEILLMFEVVIFFDKFLEKSKNVILMSYMLSEKKFYKQKFLRPHLCQDFFNLFLFQYHFIFALVSFVFFFFCYYNSTNK